MRTPFTVLARACLVAASMQMLISVGPALGLTLEEARQRCRESIGRPIVQACMRGLGYGGGRRQGAGNGGGGQGGGDKGGDLERCRSRATPQVRACVQSALQAANGRPNVAVGVPQDKELAGASANAPSTAFVAPPRAISDVTAILDSEMPDPAKIEQLTKEADAEPRAGISRHELARFHHARAIARNQLGRLKESIADAEAALELARDNSDANYLGRVREFVGLQYLASGQTRRALAIFTDQSRVTNVKGARGYQFNANKHISFILTAMGDLAQAETYLRRSEALIQTYRTSGRPGQRTAYAERGQAFEYSVEHTRAQLFEARGQFRDAEAAYLLAERRRRASIKTIQAAKNPPPVSLLLLGADGLVLAQARMKARQGRLAEAEADARRALLSRLQQQGKYHPATPKFIAGLANILAEQGRYEDAERLTRIAIDISRRVSFRRSGSVQAGLLVSLGRLLVLLGRDQEAAEIYGELERITVNWDPRLRQAIELDSSRIFSLYASNRIDDGIAAARTLLQREIARVGERHFDTAAARGTLAAGYMRAGRNEDAIKEFAAAIPVLMASGHTASDDDGTLVAARRKRLQNIVEAYLQLLAGRPDALAAASATETFQLADAIRGQSVQHALAASSARMVAKDPALAELIRREQDLSLRISALAGTLNHALGLASSERDEEGIKSIRATLAKLRAERTGEQNEIARRFPKYAELINPKPPTPDVARKALRDDEALLSFYFGQNASFVWVVSKHGPVTFRQIDATAGLIEGKIAKVRATLESSATSYAQFPRYNLEAAYELYDLLLRPVESAWTPAKSLVVVTNGSLGYLPLALLPTAPATAPRDGEPTLFASYRDVPWLARTHAVTIAPSVASLQSLRQIPRASDTREPLIGFGDPFFSVAQAQSSQRGRQTSIESANVATRGLKTDLRAAVRTAGVDRAALSALPRLNDTADELTAMALALRVDPARVLHLGADANERAVKNTDLSRFRVVAFATHGLVPGDLDGLTQPALALAAPDIANVDGDGLLTMEEILPLKLDADWVVLSACNTGAGAWAGAEAASGLGRAFFYAGSRSLLLTNWPVDSPAARDLVGEIFRRHAADKMLSRAEILRQAMVALIDGPGYMQDGATLYAYAHPVFWAPYSLIGDGGN